MADHDRPFSGRRTADPEVARRLGLGVGDDAVVMLFAGEQHVGFVTTTGYAAMIHAGVAGPSVDGGVVREERRPVIHPKPFTVVPFAFDGLVEHDEG